MGDRKKFSAFQSEIEIGEGRDGWQKVVQIVLGQSSTERGGWKMGWKYTYDKKGISLITNTGNKRGKRGGELLNLKT